MSSGAPIGNQFRTTHGHCRRWPDGFGSPTYRTWRSMIMRCTYPSNVSFPRYGGRGITICPEWRSFEAFLRDMGERPEGKTLDRIDTYGNYEPSNCRWVTPKEQIANQRPRKRRCNVV